MTVINTELAATALPRDAVEMLRIAALGDVHCGRHGSADLEALFGRVPELADVLVLCGDFIDYGQPDEARAFVKVLTPAMRVPVLAVLGNHEYEADQAEEVRTILCDAGVQVLDGEAVEVRGVGFAGAKGFGGGFGRRALEPWGEPTIKQFVREAVDEALKLETALARLETPHRVALLHYAPIQATVEPEPLEIHAFLGSSRLEEPLNRYQPAVVFHGHAHNGSLHGTTRAGVPVYNVALPLLRRTLPGKLPLFVHELPLTPESI